MGLGRGIIVERFCRAGAAVVLTDIDAIDGKEAAETSRSGAGECCFTQRDVSREDDVRQLADEAVQRYGTIDILCNNAAFLLSDQEARAHELSSEAWERMPTVNLIGYWLCSKYLVPPHWLH
jgi:NAD(P)-dependent dehydrogenase (short-subunit alcohol dehydrogenase family)